MFCLQPSYSVLMLNTVNPKPQNPEWMLALLNQRPVLKMSLLTLWKAGKRKWKRRFRLLNLCHFTTEPKGNVWQTHQRPEGGEGGRFIKIESTSHEQAEEPGLHLSSSSSRRTEPNNPTSLTVKQAAHCFISLLVWWRSDAAIVHTLFFPSLIHALLCLQRKKKKKKEDRFHHINTSVNTHKHTQWSTAASVPQRWSNPIFCSFGLSDGEEKTAQRPGTRSEERLDPLFCFVEAVRIQFRLIIAASSL